jgi:Rrf2 family protein
MRIGESVEWAIHCATVLAALPDRQPLSNARLAEFHGVPAPYLAKAMQALTRAGITVSVPGRRGGFRLARRPGQITLLDIVDAVEGDQPAFRCSEIRRRGPARMPARCYTSACGIASAMWRAEEAWRAQLAGTTVEDVLAHVIGALTPEAATAAVTWMEEALS